VPVFLSASLGTVSPDRVVTDSRGYASFAFFADVKEDTLVRITARTGLDGAAQGIDAFTIRVVRLPPPPIYAQAGMVSLGGRGGEGIRLSSLQKSLVEILRHNPGSPQRDLALQAGVTQQTVSYNLRILQKQGILQTVSRGRAKCI